MLAQINESDNDGSELSQMLRVDVRNAPIQSERRGNRKSKISINFALLKLHLSALALSGGGIRSACVGVIQSFAEAKLLRQSAYHSTGIRGWIYRVAE